MPHKCLNRCDDETTVGDDLEIATPTHRHRPAPPPYHPPYHPRPSFCPTYLYLATTVEPYILCPVWVTGINPQDFHHVQAHHLPINCSWRASRSEWSVFALFPIRTINMVASTQTCTPACPGCACVPTATPGNPRRRTMRSDLKRDAWQSYRQSQYYRRQKEPSSVSPALSLSLSEALSLSLSPGSFCGRFFLNFYTS